MGMNYYLVNKKERLHIGKASFGWRFLFQGHVDYENDKCIISSDSWLKEMAKDGNDIINEEDKIISIGDFFKMIESKKKFKSHRDEYWERCGIKFWQDKHGFDFVQCDFS